MASEMVVDNSRYIKNRADRFHKAEWKWLTAWFSDRWNHNKKIAKRIFSTADDPVGSTSTVAPSSTKKSSKAKKATPEAPAGKKTEKKAADDIQATPTPQTKKPAADKKVSEKKSAAPVTPETDSWFVPPAQRPKTSPDSDTNSDSPLSVVHKAEQKSTPDVATKSASTPEMKVEKPTPTGNLRIMDKTALANTQAEQRIALKWSDEIVLKQPDGKETLAVSFKDTDKLKKMLSSINSQKDVALQKDVLTTLKDKNPDWLMALIEDKAIDRLTEDSLKASGEDLLAGIKKAA